MSFIVGVKVGTNMDNEYKDLSELLQVSNKTVILNCMTIISKTSQSREETVRRIMTHNFLHQDLLYAFYILGTIEGCPLTPVCSRVPESNN